MESDLRCRFAIRSGRRHSFKADVLHAERVEHSVYFVFGHPLVSDRRGRALNAVRRRERVEELLLLLPAELLADDAVAAFVRFLANVQKQAKAEEVHDFHQTQNGTSQEQACRTAHGHCENKRNCQGSLRSETIEKGLLTQRK